MEQLIAEFMALNDSEKLFVSFGTIYAITTSIYGLVLIYQSKKQRKFFEKEKSTWRKILFFW